jgi:cytochrome P450
MNMESAMSTAIKTPDLDLSDINLFEPGTLIDPWDAYHKLRDDAPVFFQEAMNAYVVTRYDLLIQVLRDTETFSSKFDNVLGASGFQFLESASEEDQAKFMAIAQQMVLPPPTMLTLDPPEHTNYRSLVNRVFTAGNVRKMEPYITDVIEKTIDTFIDDGKIDFMKSFAFPVPLRIIADRLGIPDGKEEREFFDTAATHAAGALRLTPLNLEQGLERMQYAVDLQKFLIDTANKRRKDPQDDMISILATARLEEEDRPLTDPEIISILNQFLVAGHETTTSTFGWGMLLLCNNPEVQEQLEDKKLVRSFVEETLRLEAPVQGLPRVVTKDTDLGGYALKKGDVLMLRYGAANRDERQFPDPDSLDIHRKNSGSQLAFGSGVHHCVGAPLARQELNLGFPALLARMKNIRLDEAHGEPMAEPSVILRGLPHLHITFDKR